MYNEPVNPSVYGEPPASCKEECEKLCKGKTVNELQQISDYFSKEARELDAKVDSTITADDFAKVKKSSSDEIPTIADDDKEPQPDHDGEAYS